MEPSEVDGPNDAANGSVMGVKYAAVRKLYHELGIPQKEIDVEKFKFLTRLHYWAADTVTHGPKAPWGEHEIDYILFYTVPNKSAITLKPDPDEVKDIKWVDPQELQDIMDDENLLFSPWCRLIAENWVIPLWWKNLKVTMTTDKYCDYESIHCFDPPPEHYGGGGNAKPLFTNKSAIGIGNLQTAGDKSKKQGAYGKITTHKESKLSQLLRLDEVFAAVMLLYVKPLKSNLDHSKYIEDRYPAKDLEFCNEILVKVSRSFASVIRQLPDVLLVDIMVFYIVLRALDTVEDDMTAFGSHQIKIDHLLTFHKNALQNPDWYMDGVGEGDERRLLQEFGKCHSVFAALPEASKAVITDITQRMAAGMAEFVDKDLGQGTTDVEQYNRYCHFVAGLVGEGLTRLFVATGQEPKSLGSCLVLADQMGLFLQKTNIIRDYLEDYVDGRAFWPQTVWKKYTAGSNDLGYFTNQSDPAVRANALGCLNELVTDALELVPDCLEYMSQLVPSSPEVFRFCAIPQVMAIATLEKCYNNSNVFTGVVKIRKGLSCKLILNCTTLDNMHEIFNDFASVILEQIPKDDPSYARTQKACAVIIKLTGGASVQLKKRRLRFFTQLLVLLLAFMAAYMYSVKDTWVPLIFYQTSSIA